MSTDMKPDERIEWVYSAPDGEVLAERYDQWAVDYEADLYEHYRRPRREPVIDILEQYVARAGRVLDAGVGTGIMGPWLKTHGFEHLVGIDISHGMLDQARAKGCYDELRVGVLGEALDLPSDHFDAVVSIGVFTLGHAPCSAFAELIRVTRPGGHIIFTMREDYAEQPASKRELDGFSAAGRWRMVEPPRPYIATPGEDDPTVLHTWTFRVEGDG